MAKGPPQKSRTQILEDLTAFMKRHPLPMDNWFVGTAQDGRKQLFGTHSFTEGDVGLYRNCASSEDAASLATLLIKRGAKGEGGAKPDARSVYVFKMAKHTSPAK